MALSLQYSPSLFGSGILLYPCCVPHGARPLQTRAQAAPEFLHYNVPGAVVLRTASIVLIPSPSWLLPFAWEFLAAQAEDAKSSDLRGRRKFLHRTDGILTSEDRCQATRG